MVRISFSSLMILAMRGGAVSSSPPSSSSLLLEQRRKLVKGIIAAAQSAAAEVAADSPSAYDLDRSSAPPLVAQMRAAAACLRDDHENAMLRSADVQRRRRMAVLRNASAFLPAQVEELLPGWQLHRSAVALSSFRRKAARFLPPTDTFGGSRGHLPAIVHQTWKTDDHGDHDDDNGGGSSGGESDQLWDRRIDAWDDAAWRHLVWTDDGLNALIGALFPWLGPTLQAMPASKLIRRVDTMRYCVVYLLGGIYLDADDERYGGDLHGPTFGRVPPNTAAVGLDPHALSAVPGHPLVSILIIS
jgi:hypothetical protein